MFSLSVIIRNTLLAVFYIQVTLIPKVSTAGTITTKKIDILLIAGQSNACGAGSNIADFKTDEVDKKIFYAYKLLHNIAENDPNITENWIESSTLTTLKAVGNGRIGSEISLARRYFDLSAGAELAIVKVCAGSSGIMQHWHGANGLFLKHLLPKLNETQIALRTMGYEPQLAGFAWLQGESDAYSTNPHKYSAAFLSMVSYLRNNINPYMSFVIARTYGGKMIDSNNQNYTTLRFHQAQLANCNTNSFWINIDSIVSLADLIHWDYPSQVKVGEMLADRLYYLQSSELNSPQKLGSSWCTPIYRSFWEQALEQWKDEPENIIPAQTQSKLQIQNACKAMYHHYKWYLQDIKISSCDLLI